MLESIKAAGISKGVLIISTNPPRFKAGHQWLTSNPDFNQSWNEYSTLPYDRTANRIEINLPDRQRRYLYHWIKEGERLAGTEMFKTLSCYGDPENWFVYHGIVKPQWFIEIKKKPIPVGSPFLPLNTNRDRYAKLKN